LSETKADIKFAAFTAIRNGAGSLALLLCAAYALSLGGGVWWFFDLFSHFVIQYFFGALFLLPALILTRRPYLSVIMAAVVMIAAFETRALVGPPQRGVSDGGLTVVQFNTLHTNNDRAQIVKWGLENKDELDVIILQELHNALYGAFSGLKAAYPYRVPPNTPMWSDTVVYSRYPLSEGAVIPLRDELERVKLHPGIKMQIDVPHFKNPVQLYTIHTSTPLDATEYLTRNLQLHGIARAAGQDQRDNILMAGDWNITPYSPHFTKAMDLSGLNYWHRGLLPVPSWPAYAALPLFQIPIDHFLHSDSLVPVLKKRGPPLGSDHYPIIMTFREKE
jgi:endonuclease/exonuclease/phosphatase (EEP) superfamily protein YafD